ncbi:MAG: substrate-binding domain-containing protein, partial [Cyanobacteria bacterium J06642_11]
QTGLVHGNISLDSIVIQPDANSYYETPQLLIFLRDLALWESLFIPPPVSPHIPTVADDLIALGQVGLYALLGRWSDHYGRDLKPHSFHEWPRQDLVLEQYLRQLLGIEEPTFDTAAEARRALLQLPTAPVQQPPPETITDVDDQQRAWPKWVWWLLAGLGLLSIALLMRMLLLRWLRPAFSSTPPSPCCIADVAAVPPGEFHYAAANPGTWYPLWHSRNLVIQDKTLEQVLEAEQPDLNLQLDPVKTNTLAIQQVENDQVDFAIAPHLTSLAPDLTISPIAYDGLAVFVAFSYVERQQGLPHHLQGRLSVDQLRQLYTGEIENWSDLGGPDLAVKLYIPDQVELIEVFEQRVLQTPEAIQAFRRQWGLDAAETGETGSPSIPLIASTETINGDISAPLDMLQAILKDFEAVPQVGSIGFTSISQIYNQCSVYPLAIAPDNHSSAVQPFYRANNTPISPTIDLCGDKGNYGPNQSLFVSPPVSQNRSSESLNTPVYPLAYPLAVMYRRDNSREPVGSTFVEMMTTDEGQGLLKKTGLVPLESVSE